ncbi:AFG1 superfamily (ZapE) [Commensalibacter communis]|uniref:cell division protein ZapE n=1 Tax=Commensalibacter communis TaxID=2972786 RepID=UPI0022FF910E|nr:cell division protein ZapE [Commensalibacter communis]CAI3942979.1 AFG1 superfamily (ZapE) [Commensalibacter communis]CAI3944274.1 AFG1 superfamily (ZapE) [Commensalibacter communis]
MNLPSNVYQARVKAGTLKQDDAQQKIVLLLDQLCRSLENYQPVVYSAGGMFGTLKSLWKKPEQPPRGLYLVGSVGRGKSMLMDLFYEQVPVQHKIRTHFHIFMQETYKRFHVLKQQSGKGGDPIPDLAKELAQKAWLLCFDEFQVNDIADAVLLGRLFEQLFALGVVVVATSNVNISSLFQNRPGADAFKPFIKILSQQMQEVELNAAQDYRLGRPEDEKRWLVPCNAESKERLNHIFLRESKAQPIKEAALTVMGRSLRIPCAAGDVTRFSFTDLCDVNLGVGDYLALAQRFKTIILDDIPRFNPDNMNVIERFTMLIDVLYEQNVKLYASAAAEFEEIYRKEDRRAFFERTISRLNEMQGQNWGNAKRIM